MIELTEQQAEALETHDSVLPLCRVAGAAISLSACRSRLVSWKRTASGERAMTPVTIVDIADPALLAKLASSNGAILFRGPNGEQIRWAQPVPPGQLPAGIRPPITDEEFEKLRQRPDSGITLAEFWQKVERGEWK